MDFSDLMTELGQKLIAKEAIVVTAESCTGGMIAEALTAVTGSTAWFDRAYITYSYESKREMLGVKENTIQKKGAVSEACVEEMVLGALQQSHANIAVACSGIAGPGGGTPDKPVGTVWLAWGKRGRGKVETQCFVFDGDRTAVREQATVAALKGIEAIIEE